MPAGPWPTADTRVLGLLGWPARHSVSPVMHNAALQEQGLDLVYLALPLPPDGLAGAVEALGAMEVIGCNVTVPHKQAVVDHCDRLTEEARLVGAVNTLEWTSDALVGHNTDVAGLAAVIRDDLALAPATAVVLVGTGGAARAAAVAFGRVGCQVAVAGRRPDAAGAVARLASRCGAREARAVDLADADQVAGAVAAADAVVNATTVGMRGSADRRFDAPALHALSERHVALDLVYTPLRTPFLADADAAGAETHHGLGMLVAQGVASYRIWTGQEPGVATMSAAAMRTLLDQDNDDPGIS